MTAVKQVDRDGTFRAIPLRWRVRDSSRSRSVAVEIEWQIHSWYDFEKNEWNEWPGWQEMGIVGYTYFIGKDGQPSQSGCDQLAEGLGWDGRVATFSTQQPPRCLAQITIKTETYEGKAGRKVKWLAAGDADPRVGLSEEDVQGLDATVGDLLRAAASTKRRDPVPLPSAKTEEKKAPPAESAKSTDYSDIPFAWLIALPLLGVML